MNELISVEDLKPADLFAEGGVDAIVEKIEQEARAVLIDISTDTGRKECASLAYKIARSKTALDDMGKNLVAEWKTRAAKVDGERRKIRDRLDALKDEVRKPLTDFENTETARIAQHEELTLSISELPEFGYRANTDEIQDRLTNLGTIMQRDWEEFTKRATEVADEVRRMLQQQLTSRQRYDADQAELQRLRDEAAKREQAEREERIRREATEAAERAAAKALADAKAREEAAERKAEQTRLDAEKAATDAAAREKRAKDEAAKAERERIERQQRDEEAAAAKREANKKHRAKINREAAEAIAATTGLDDTQCKAVIEAIAKAQVPHVQINY
jgi:colicin import membrane protein